MSRLLALVALLVLASLAQAGEAVRLLVEVPSDLRSVRPAERVAVQVVGEDAEGNRVGFGTHEVVLRADGGSTEVVERPYSFRLTVSDDLGGRSEVVLTAHLRGRPEVRGEKRVAVARPDAPEVRYERIVVEARRASVPLGGQVRLDVVGIRGDGSREPAVDLPLTATLSGRVADPTTLGLVERVQLGRFRYVAPEPGGAVGVGERVTVTVRASDVPSLTASVELTLAPARKRGDAAQEEPGDDETGGTAPPPAPENSDAEDSDDESGGVRSKDEALRFMVWRTKETAAAEFRNERRLPDPPVEFAAPEPWQKLRVVVERPKVVDVAVEWWVGTRTDESVRRIAATKDGALRFHRNKSGRLVAHLELEVPEGADGIKVEFVLTGARGHEHRSRFRMRRGKRTDAKPPETPK